MACSSFPQLMEWPQVEKRCNFQTKTKIFLLNSIRCYNPQSARNQHEKRLPINETGKYFKIQKRDIYIYIYSERKCLATTESLFSTYKRTSSKKMFLLASHLQTQIPIFNRMTKERNLRFFIWSCDFL